jgi:hypothetical protein
MSPHARGCTVGPDSEEWLASHRDGVAAGPSLVLPGARLRFFDALGPMHDDGTFADAIRLTRKGGLAVVTSKGKLPFGSTPSVKHQHCYSTGRFKCTTDWHLPRGTNVRDELSIGNCELLMPPERWRAIEMGDAALVAGAWQPWPEDSACPGANVIALQLEFADGEVVELGLGEDLWRWYAWQERPVNGCWRLQGGKRNEVRRVVAAAEELTPKPRTWRFSWYVAWSQAGTPMAEIPAAKPAVWWSDGSLDTGYLKRAEAISLDLSKLDAPAEICRNGGVIPCLSGSGVQRRLRHAVRQIRELTSDDVPVVFTGWQPGACTMGRHVDRKGERLHWDWPAAFSLFAWARNALGPDRPLHLEMDSPLLSQDVFSLLDLEDEFLTVDELHA